MKEEGVNAQRRPVSTAVQPSLRQAIHLTGRRVEGEAGTDYSQADSCLFSVGHPAPLLSKEGFGEVHAGTENPASSPLVKGGSCGPLNTDVECHPCLRLAGRRTGGAAMPAGRWTAEPWAFERSTMRSAESCGRLPVRGTQTGGAEYVSAARRFRPVRVRGRPRRTCRPAAPLAAAGTSRRRAHGPA